MGVLSKLKTNDLLARIRQTYPGAGDDHLESPPEAATASPTTVSRPFVVAVHDPADGWAFDNSLSQSERKQVVEDDAWFERAAERMATGQIKDTQRSRGEA